ncbi:hypothetical protein PG990_013364 [Apiospora arundinis]
MTSFFSWRSTPAPEPPKIAEEIGKDCTPGQAAKGTLLHLVLREIRDKLEEEPDFDSLRQMKTYIDEMDFLKKDGTTVDVYFVDDCIKHCKKHVTSRVSQSIISGASGTTPSDIGSVSPSVPRTISSVAESTTPAAELQRHLIPFQLKTMSEQWRFVIARKTTTDTQNYISTKIAGQCGFPREPGTRIDIKLELLREQLDCSVHVKDIEQDMLLTEALVVRFSSYKAEYQLDDYFHESTINSSSTVTGLHQTGAMSSARSHHGGSEAGMSNSSYRIGNEEREYDVVLGLAEYITERKRAERRLS